MNPLVSTLAISIFTGVLIFSIEAVWRLFCEPRGWPHEAGRKAHHIGIAASTDAGLMVPVVKDADKRNLLDIAREIDRLGSDAKAGKSKPQDLSGSTFTITSLGAEGGLFATPIINFPEVGILGVHRIKERPVVKNGQIVIGHVMLLSLSFDHRIVDGHVGAAFAYDIIASLENPERMFLEMV